MELESIGNTVTAPWAEANLVSGAVHLGLNSSAPGGTDAFHSRWATATNEGFGFPDGPLQMNPFIFGTQFTVCKSRLYYGSAPSACTMQILFAITCAAYTNCTGVGKIGSRLVSIPICWEHAPSARAPFFLANTLHTRVNPITECLPLVADMYATQHTRHNNNTFTVTFYATRTVESAWFSTALAFACAGLLAIWVSRPTTGTGEYKWLAADMAVIPTIINISYLNRDTPVNCGMCDGHATLCEWLCTTPVSTFLWALLGMSVPPALVATAAHQWPFLSEYSMPRFCFYSIEIVLLATSAANFPVDQLRGKAEAILAFTVGVGICVIIGKAAMLSKMQQWPETVLTAIFSGVALGMVMGALFRPIVQDHPSVRPNDVPAVIATCVVAASIATVAGVFTAK